MSRTDHARLFKTPAELFGKGDVALVLGAQ